MRKPGPLTPVTVLEKGRTRSRTPLAVVLRRASTVLAWAAAKARRRRQPGD